ncbi:glycoside hydrolase family 88 protein [Vallitalea okinawensis]|uniref:glycoside hydrolase family 88 protein n=1 Tax=Vallitalea okinawensis TaxID=2078660 RepID=UPI000CFCC852|nr:glycoside hydrolase family 88 protein [Vallitalea okinawensis]
MEFIKNVINEPVNNVQRFLDFKINKQDFINEMDFIISKIEEMSEEFSDDVFPSAVTMKNKYSQEFNGGGWTQGFWSGMIWLAYEWTDDEKYKKIGESHVQSFKKRLDGRLGIDHHDLGFLYSLSCVAPYKINGNEEAKKVAIGAADYLSRRYVKSIGIIDRGKRPGIIPDDESQFIIDCSMNVHLLFWASEVTGNPKYYQMAYEHMKQAAEHALREDASTFQEVNFNKNTGKVVAKTVGQGYSDTSSWARGQAWAIYGFALTYGYTKDKGMLEIARKMANYYLNRLPDDDICGWDLVFTENDCQRDTSAATPAICGLLELSKHLPVSDSDKMIYEKAALKMLKTLSKHYTTKKIPHSNGILLHGVYAYKRNTNIDDLCIWGDYFYTEALMRVLKVWNKYW